MQELVAIDTVHGAIVEVRGHPVVLDSDLAGFFEVETRVLNQAVKRNAERFVDYAFQLSGEEFEELKSQDVIPSGGRGGRRTPPWVFTEHGVVMAATVLNSDRAVTASRRVVEAFVRLKQEAGGKSKLPARRTAKGGTGSDKALLQSGLLPQLRDKLDALMSAQVNPRQRKSLREETEEFISDGLKNFKARLKKQGIANEEIEARALKYLAEAEEARERAATQRQLTEKQRLKNQANQLRMLIRAELAMTSGEISDLLEVLDELGRE